MSTVMARRLGALTPRRAADSEDLDESSDPTSPRPKSQSSPYLTVCLLLTVGHSSLWVQWQHTKVFCMEMPLTSPRNGVLFIICYNSGTSANRQTQIEEVKHFRRGLSSGEEEVFKRNLRSERNIIQDKADDGDDIFSDFLALKGGEQSSQLECRSRVCDAIPILQEVYGKTMHRTLHVGPGTCGVVSELLKEDDNEVWGIQPFEMKTPVHRLCRNYIRKGLVRVADPARPLPYRANSFSFVLVTGSLDRMISKDVNQTLADLARVSSHRVVLVIGNGGRSNVPGKMQKPLKPRNRAWWQRRLQGVGFQEDDEVSKRFEKLQIEKSFRTNSNIFHLVVPES